MPDCIGNPRFIADNQYPVLKPVVLELAWVPSSPSGYNPARNIVCERLRHILGLPTMDTEDAVQVARAVGWYEKGMDFADALHLSSSHATQAFATMDGRMSRKASQIAPQMNILHIT